MTTGPRQSAQPTCITQALKTSSPAPRYWWTSSWVTQSLFRTTNDRVDDETSPRGRLRQAESPFFNHDSFTLSLDEPPLLFLKLSRPFLFSSPPSHTFPRPQWSKTPTSGADSRSPSTKTTSPRNKQPADRISSTRTFTPAIAPARQPLCRPPRNVICRLLSLRRPSLP